MSGPSVGSTKDKSPFYGRYVFVAVGGSRRTQTWRKKERPQDQNLTHDPFCCDEEIHEREVCLFIIHNLSCHVQFLLSRDI